MSPYRTIWNHSRPTSIKFFEKNLGPAPGSGPGTGPLDLKQGGVWARRGGRAHQLILLRGASIEFTKGSDSEPINKDYCSHCPTCKLEWLKPNRPCRVSAADRCPKCQQQKRDGELPEKEKRLVNAETQTCNTIEHLLDCSLEYLLANPELMMCSF